MDESGGVATATTSDLDGWIEQLYECKQLSETQVKGKYQISVFLLLLTTLLFELYVISNYRTLRKSKRNFNP